jgi:hypothetical protein
VIIGRVLSNQNQRPSADNPFFMQVCMDVLGGKAAYVAPSDERYAKTRKLLMDLVRHHCGENHGTKEFGGLSFEQPVRQEPIVNDALLVGIGLDPLTTADDEQQAPVHNGTLHALLPESAAQVNGRSNGNGHSGAGWEE